MKKRNRKNIKEKVKRREKRKRERERGRKKKGERGKKGLCISICGTRKKFFWKVLIIKWKLLLEKVLSMAK